ncbi:hypothetical protein DLAC_06209 [Tieghemostelium lacteum]|uniref:Stress-response A/B barrel domain-containing protein n=1 Tax=Tieghemostelium lacteum TaxID=361077 RepID=A0A151ZHN9_TIELA|nr:hypothetical protein DLAC_06209 [Tieghemostelium lacteum]|eukprot:KYQ93511.1 hypothetical protein DLAC_06209 [Tieghemostelium lacteum]
MNSGQAVEHILFMHLKDLTESEEKGLLDKIEEMRSLPGVLNISFGKNFSDRGDKYNYGYRVLLQDKESLDNYGPHKLHQEFRELLNEVRLSLPLVSDFYVPKFPYNKY